MSQQDNKDGNKKLTGTALFYSLIAKAKALDAIVLGRGDPDFDTPANIVEAANRAMQMDNLKPSPVEGLLDLRKAISERVKRINDIDVDPETGVVITNGGQEAIMLMVLASIGAIGDEMIVPEPNYSTYNDALEFAGGNKVGIPTLLEKDFAVDPGLVEQAVSDRSAALLLVSPNNPTASVIPTETMQTLANIAEKNDLIVLADDIYDQFIYDGGVHCSPQSLEAGKDRTLTLNAFSKAYAMTGWRLGWITGPPDLMAKVKTIKASVSGPANVVAQHAGIEALTGPSDALEDMKARYVRRRKVVLDAFDSMGIKYGMPQGGQFIFGDVSHLGIDSVELAARILEEEHVLIYPGGAFAPDSKYYVRVTFLQPEAKLKEGLERMGKALRRMS
ncbi:MAG: aminotransferase class I/II-fold pyridoxal phosphate-dependent enzyme [Anaerolineales bacterium]|nr:aminotransferase class I/II-fold pyridoxal phosphate-dependent enzyme [Anaerolineales bacterium]